MEKLKVGQKVHYTNLANKVKIENGIIKSIPEHTTESVFVVYNCRGEWKDYKNYTAALTNLRDLKDGWHLTDHEIEILEDTYDEDYCERMSQDILRED